MQHHILREIFVLIVHFALFLMNVEDLQGYDKQAVCFLYRAKSDARGYTRWERGVVYQNRCYSIRIQMNGQLSSLEVQLSPVEAQFVSEIIPLRKSKQNLLERAVVSLLHSEKTESVRVPLPVRFLEFPKDS